MNGNLAQSRPSSASALRGMLLRLLSWCSRETQGSWLFGRRISAWLRDRALVSQLPRSYRIFARYCSVQPMDPIGAESLLRFIIWIRRSTGAESVLRLDVHGMPIFVNLDDPRFLVIPRELTSGLPRNLKRFLRPGDTFIDIGSNHGAFAITAAQLVGPEGLVIAIEPQARLAALIRRSLELYNAPFVVHNVACSDASGTANLYVPDATSGSSGLHPSFSAVSQHQTATVSLVRLDDLLRPDQLRGRVFVKLDVEGSEVRCLTGARDFLATTKPAILTEVNPEALAAAGSSTAGLAAVLQESGYDRYLGGGDLDEERLLTEQIADADIIALHSSFDTGDLPTNKRKGGPS